MFEDSFHHNPSWPPLCSSSSSSLTIPNGTISLAWKNLTYQLGNKKILLNNLNGSFGWHKLNGLMGPSGAGKTTFINTFLRVNSKLSNSSGLFVGGTLKNDWPSSVFISQNVHKTIIGKMKVCDILDYAFRFQNGCRSANEMKQHIRIVAKKLLLDVGVLGRKFENCSGGEQKRIAIAQELMSLKQPSFLFIDEPTTGLDSNSAYSMIECLQSLAHLNRMTIIVSIHQPNSDTLSLFDKLYILARGGGCIYSGSPSGLKQNLKDQLLIELPDEKPPIEKYLEIACEGIQNQSAQKLFQQTARQETQFLQPHLKRLKKWSPAFRTKPCFRWFSFISQLKRMFCLTFWWDFGSFLTIIAFYIAFVLILYSVYGSEITRPSGCVTKVSSESRSNQTCFQRQPPDYTPDTWLTYQFMVEIFLSNFSMTLSAFFFCSLYKIFKSEHLNRWYSMSVFYWSFNMVHLVESVIYSSLLTFLVYFTTNMMYVDGDRFNWIRFGYFWFFYWLLFVFMQAIGELLSVIVKKQIQTSLLSQMMIMVSLCLGTMMIFIEFIDNKLITWYSQIFGMRYIIKGIMYSMYGLTKCDPIKEFPLIVHQYYIDIENVFWNISQAVINILLMKLATFLVLFVEFNTNFDLKTFSIFNHFNFSLQNSSDYANDNESNDSTEKIEQPYGFERKKMSNEIEFEKFAKNKIQIAWRSLSLFKSESIFESRPIDGRNDSNLILRNLNGQFKFGTMNALMGTSGSGKTTLLKVLNGQLKTRLSDQTSLFLSRFTSTRTCFLAQEVSGHLHPGLTAKQSLIYASKLKNIRNEDSLVDHEKVASSLLAELEMETTAETMVQKCSGGERKRLALAMELTAIRMPNLICIDEPTSGLDSNSARVVVTCLSKLARRHNITIVTSIHQPNVEIMMMFDTLYVLARGGVCIYSGPPNRIKDHLSTVSDVEFDNENIRFSIGELIKYSCLDHHQEKVQKLFEKNVHQFDYDQNKLNDQTVFASDGIPSNRPRFSSKSIGILLACRLRCIWQHSWLEIIFFSMAFMAQALFLRFIYPSSIVHESGCISLEEDFQTVCFDEAEMKKQMNLYHGFTYLVLFNSAFMLLLWIQGAYDFLSDIVFFFNENHNGWYSTGTFYSAKLISEILIMIPNIIVFLWIVDIYEWLRPGFFFISFGIMLLVSISIQCSSHILVLITNGNTILIGPLMTFIFYIQQMMANIFLSIERLNLFYQFVSNLSVGRFLNESLLIYLYGFGRCSTKQISIVLNQMNIHHDQHFYHCIQMLIMQVFVYGTSAFLLLLYLSNNGKKDQSRKAKLKEFHSKNLSEPTNFMIPGLNSTHNEFRIKMIQI